MLTTKFISSKIFAGKIRIFFAHKLLEKKEKFLMGIFGAACRPEFWKKFLIFLLGTQFEKLCGIVQGLAWWKIGLKWRKITASWHHYNGTPLIFLRNDGVDIHGRYWNVASSIITTLWWSLILGIVWQLKIWPKL